MANKEADTEWGRAIEKPVVPEKDGRQSNTADETVDIAIVGGGLVGLAVAIGLLKKIPHLNIKIYERAPELRSQSQGILAIQPNGMNALKTIDPEIPERICEVGCERHTRTITNINADGSVKETVLDTKIDSVGKHGQASVGITWHNCQQVLASLVPMKEENIITSRSLSYFVEQNDSVLLFENGSVVKTKILLACDGVFSAVRRQLYPNDSPIYFGQLNWGTVIKSHMLPPNLHQKNGVHYFQNRGDPIWMSMLNDGGSGYTFWQFRVSGDPKHSKELSGNNGRGGLGLPGVKEKLVRIARESCETVANAIEAIPEETIFERSIVGRSSLPTWLSPGGKVALVGDSAHGMHPNIAQGANSTFESAAAIVKALCEEKDSFISALNSYEKARKPRADLVQQFANALGVSQASGKIVFHETAEMMDWIRSGQDPIKNPPPKDVTDILGHFDPLESNGVSRLWS